MDPTVSLTQLPILADWHAQLWTSQTQLALIHPNRPWENWLISLSVTQSSYTMGTKTKGQLVQYQANHMAPWKIGTYVSRYWKTMDEGMCILGTVHVPKKSGDVTNTLVELAGTRVVTRPNLGGPEYFPASYQLGLDLGGPNYFLPYQFSAGWDIFQLATNSDLVQNVSDQPVLTGWVVIPITDSEQSPDCPVPGASAHWSMTNISQLVGMEQSGTGSCRDLEKEQEEETKENIQALST
ncbi:hypothetical protein BYT27DRAFT_7208486 [Phlegmacium glaucopus]|nr:hypothetical protein BYT27DRAFT_7208486 [Phlegmacium glaucopus]